MKLFIPVLFLLPLLLGATEHYLFPDQHSDALYTLKKKILRAENEVVLVTSAIQNKLLVKAIEKTLQKNRHIVFITSSQRQASFIAKYIHADVRVLKKSAADETGVLHMNYLLIDDTDLCLSTLPFHSDVMRTETGTMQCTVDPETVRFFQQVTEMLRVRSISYLE